MLQTVVVGVGGAQSKVKQFSTEYWKMSLSLVLYDVKSVNTRANKRIMNPILADI